MSWEKEFTKTLNTTMLDVDELDRVILETFIASLLKKQRDDDLKKILNGLTLFTEKPIGTIEGDLCDWNKPSVFAHNYSPQELQDKVVERIKEIFNEIPNAPEPK